MAGFSTNIEDATTQNLNFRRVLYTGPHAQLVVMSLRPGEDVGMERHEGADQFIRVEQGDGEATIDGERHALHADTAVVIPAGSEHNIVNTSSQDPLRFYTVYSMPMHGEGVVHGTKEEGMKEEHPSSVH